MLGVPTRLRELVSWSPTPAVEFTVTYESRGMPADPDNSHALHIGLEHWPSDNQLMINEYINAPAPTLENMGVTGFVGRNGWWINPDLAQRRPELTSYFGWQRAASSDGALDEQGLREMDPAWGPNMQLIQNLGLRLNHTNAGGESAVISYVDEQMLQNKDFMAFVYSPHALIAKHGLVRVGLPEHRSDCFFGWELGVPDNTTVCDFPNEMPFKVASIDLHQYSNVSHAMTKQLFISPDDLVALATHVAEGSTYFESACSWIKANRDLVDDWVAASKAACGVGHYFSNRTLQCEVCRPNTYADVPGLDACIPCPSGTEALFEAATKCSAPVKCPPGEVVVIGESGMQACTACAVGKYEVNNAVCLDADSRYFAPVEAISQDAITTNPSYSCPVRSLYQRRGELTNTSVSLVPQEGAKSRADCTCEEGAYVGLTGAPAYSNSADGDVECKKCPMTQDDEEGAVCAGEFFPPVARIGFGLLDTAAATGGANAEEPPGTRNFIQCRHGSTTCKTIEDAQAEAAEQSIDLGRKVEWCRFRKEGGGGSTDPTDEKYLDESDPKCYCLAGTIDKPERCCDCIGGRHVPPFADVSTQIARCGPGYKYGSALCALCDTGYASVAGVCTKCEDKAGHIIVPLVLFPVILVLIQRITTHFESTEISLAFLQFLGVFAAFGVRWGAGFQTFLDQFAIANVDVDLLGLACGEIDFQTMWTIQAILLPLLYLVFVVADVAVSWILLQAAKARIGPVMFMIKKGWRPTRSFALSSISDRYLPHGLMYLNIYYLTGVSKALVLLQCESAGDGSKPYLAADPTLPCWEGTHAKMMGLNVISLLLYVLLVPLGYAYILFCRCPKEGLRSPRLYDVFGFLWSRFEDRCYWWEVAEITLRKLPLVIISIFVPGAIYKCMVGILLIGALMAFNYVKEPYTLYRHDLLDQMVSTAEVLLFLFGILAEYRAEGELIGSGGFVDEAETVGYLIIALVLTHVFIQLGMDMKLWKDNFTLAQVMSRRRAKAKSALSEGIFQVQGPLLGKFIDGADATKLESLHKVEVMFARIARRVLRKGDSTSEAGKELANTMAIAMPQMMDWLIDERDGQDGPALLQKFTTDLVEHKERQDTGGAAIHDLLQESFATEQMLKWLLEASTKDERVAIDDLMRDIAVIVPTFAAQPKAKGGAKVSYKVQDEASGDKEPAETVEDLQLQLMQDLANDTPCELVIVTPVETKAQTEARDAASKRGSQSSKEDDGSGEQRARLHVKGESGCSDTDATKILTALRAFARPETPAGLCVSSGKPVVVNCILDDERFGSSAIAALGAVAISQLHVPLKDKSDVVVGVLSLMNKVSFKTGKSGGPFDTDIDIAAAVSTATLIMNTY